MISEICAFDKFTLTDKLFDSKIFETCIMASYIFCGNSVASFPGTFIENVKITPDLFFVADFNSFFASYRLDIYQYQTKSSRLFTLLCCSIFILIIKYYFYI